MTQLPVAAILVALIAMLGIVVIQGADIDQLKLDVQVLQAQTECREEVNK